MTKALRFQIVTLIIFLSVGSITLSVGQEVLWGHRLLGFSSEYRPGQYGQQYRAIQLLGPPDKLPSSGNSPCAWSPATADGNAEEWVKVAFSKAIHPKQVVIAENFNPGALVRVLLYDVAGKEYPVGEAARFERGHQAARLLRLFPKIPDNVRINALKIVLNPSRILGFNQIDAVGLSDSEDPVKIEVDLAPDYPATLSKSPLSKAINSESREIAPVIAADGQTLYFTREHPDNIGSPTKQDVWFSVLRPNGQWENAKNIGPPINNGGDNAVLGVSANGKTLYLLNAYRPDGSMIEGFSKSQWTKNGWSFPASFQVEDHYNDIRPKNTEMAVSPDENVLILSVQRRDTEGHKDLYVSFKKSADNWSAPVNLGKTINTADYEGAPFLAADNKTLYFTSSGHRGFGGGDIFVTRRLDHTWTNWSKPQNLGPAINSSGWDSFFTIPASGRYAYMSSYNAASQSDDLYRIELYPSVQPLQLLALSGKITDRETGKPISGTVWTNGKEPDHTGAEFENGEYGLLVPFDSVLTLYVKSPGYFAFEEPLLTGKSTTHLSKNIELTPIRSGQRLPLDQVRFKQSSAELDSGSVEQLGKLLLVMQEYPTMEILLEGHTDNQGDAEKNLLLSEERVKAVKQFLLSGGVAASRINLKAWGATRPVTHNLTEEGRRQNRRVELTILKL